MSSRLHSLDEVRGVVIPSVGVNLLLPNAAIAEVASFQEPARSAESAPWLLGDVDWRGLTIPVVVIGSGDNIARAVLAFSRLKLIVCYVPSGEERLPYVGVCATGMPHLVRFHPDDMESPIIEMQLPVTAQQLIYEDVPACIPDIDAVAQAILALPKSG